VFHPEGHCLYGTGKGIVNVFGWEPIELYQTVRIPDSNVPIDIAVAHDQLVNITLKITSQLLVQHQHTITIVVNANLYSALLTLDCNPYQWHYCTFSSC